MCGLLLAWKKKTNCQNGTDLICKYSYRVSFILLMCQTGMVHLVAQNNESTLKQSQESILESIYIAFR